MSRACSSTSPRIIPSTFHAMETSTPWSAVLDPDVVVREDRGGGTIVQLRGTASVARGAKAVLQLGIVGRPAHVNGAAGWVSLLDGEVFALAALTVRNGRIATMDIDRDRDRLARLDLAAW